MTSAACLWEVRTTRASDKGLTLEGRTRAMNNVLAIITRRAFRDETVCMVGWRRDEKRNKTTKHTHTQFASVSIAPKLVCADKVNTRWALGEASRQIFEIVFVVPPALSWWCRWYQRARWWRWLANFWNTLFHSPFCLLLSLATGKLLRKQFRANARLLALLSTSTTTSNKGVCGVFG